MRKLNTVAAGLEKPRFLKGFWVFLYDDRTRKYDPKAREKRSIHGTPCLTKDKSPVSEGEEHHVKTKMKLTILADHD